MPRKNRLETEGSDRAIIAAINPCFGHIQTLYLAGRTYTPAALEEAIRKRVDGAIEVARLHAEWLAASHKYENETNPQVREIVSGLKSFALNVFGGKNPGDAEKLAMLGFARPRVHERTPEEKVVIAAKGLATRAARHTKGPKARLAITGQNPTGAPLVTVPEVVVRPVGVGLAEP